MDSQEWHKDVEMDLAFPKESFPTNVWLLTRVLGMLSAFVER